MFLAKRSWCSIENTLNLKVWTLPLVPWFHIVFHRYASKWVHFIFSSTILPLSLSSPCRTHMMGSTETLSCPSIPCHKTSSFTPSRQSHDDDELGYCFRSGPWLSYQGEQGKCHLVNISFPAAAVSADYVKQNQGKMHEANCNMWVNYIHYNVQQDIIALLAPHGSLLAPLGSLLAPQGSLYFTPPGDPSHQSVHL